MQLLAAAHYAVVEKPEETVVAKDHVIYSAATVMVDAIRTVKE